MSNAAFVFIKPHACTDKVKELAKSGLESKGIRILGEGSLKAEVIDEKKLIDQHYYAIASKATIKKPAELNVPADKFKKQFGIEWKDCLAGGKVFNALDGCKNWGIDADTMADLWNAAKDNGKLVKLGGGFYCGLVEPAGKDACYIFNGFFMSMRSKFTKPGAEIYYYSVEWEKEKLSWADFRGKVLGPTDPAEAPADSLRGQILAKYQELGLASAPNTGDNGMHASASPFEAFAERNNWLGASVADDSFGRQLLGAGLSEAMIKDWSVDPQVNMEGGKMGSVFDQLEDIDCADCLGKLVALSKLNQKKKKAMHPAAMKHLLSRPAVPAPLDPNFSPLILAKRQYLSATRDCKEFLEWALPRSDGCARYKLPVFPDGSDDAEASVYLAGVLIQEMIWQRSASGLQLVGPKGICEAVKADYSEGGAYEYEIKTMPNVCGTPLAKFECTIVGSAADLPAYRDTPQECGKDASGSRLSFDLGKSDIKTVAVRDNEVLYSKETEWNVTNPDPDYHFKMIVDALLLAKEKLGGKVDAIGASATGTVSGDNEATWCDIFPCVPPDVYKAKVVDIFKRIAKEVAGDVPLKVINDGEVTALAAVTKIKAGNVLGISMGSSEGGGYANADGNLMGWINEMCYIRLDLNPEAPTDPWTKGAHRGVSHMYLGQRGATKLAAKAGVDVPENLVYPHPDMCTILHENHAQCLKMIQKAMTDPAQEPKVRKLYETVGVYLGYGLAQYCEFYKIDHVMILGRVSKGVGGDIMLETAKKVLQIEFPDLPEIKFHTADDHFKAVGQCIAAAALPTIK